MKTIPVTELMIAEYPYFESLLAKEIVSQLDKKSIQEVDHVIGVSGNDSGLTLFVTELINEQRRNGGCTMWSWARVDCQDNFLQQSFMNIFKAKKFIFVHVLFDYPNKHHNNAQWKKSKRALEHWKASEATKNPQIVEELVNDFGGVLLQSVILPIPRKQYAEFMSE